MALKLRCHYKNKDEDKEKETSRASIKMCKEELWAKMFSIELVYGNEI